MNIKLAALTMLAAGHLILVICGATHQPPETGVDSVNYGLDYYGDLSGSSAGFGFFAPSVSCQLDATFTMTDADGHTWTDTAEQGSNSETNLRFLATISNFDSPHGGNPMARTWAAAMFGKYPTAQHVEVQVESQSLPSMESYRDGYRPVWDFLYGRSFDRG